MAAAFMSCGGKTTIESLSVSPTNINVAVNTVIQFEATGSQSNGTVGNVNSQVTWSSSNSSCASVSSSGLVTANPTTSCTTTITVTASGNITAPTALTVTFVPPASTFTVGTNPSGIAIDSTGNVWVTNEGSNNVTELLYTPPPAGPSWAPNPSGPFPVGINPSGIAIDALGNVWVTNFGSDNVIELNSSGTQIGKFTNGIGPNPSSIVIDSMGLLWVTNQGGNSVSELNSTGGLITTPYTAGITAPKGIVVGAVGLQWVTWVANMGSAAAPGNSITGLNTAGAVIAQYTVGTEPNSIAIDPSDNLWVANFGSNNISELNTGGGVIGTSPYTPVGIDGPDAVVIDTAGSVWVANYGSTAAPGTTIIELNPADGTTINKFTVGNNPSSIAIDSLNNVWVANYSDNTVSLLKGAATGPQYRPYPGIVWP